MGFIVKLLVAMLQGYREWTESLGADREWLIQARQAELHMSVSVEAARHGGLAIPFRHDTILVLASGASSTLSDGINAVLSERAPVPHRIRIGCGETPAEALDNAFYDREACEGREAAVLAHVDINNITGLQQREGLYSAWDRVVRMLADLHAKLADYGVIVSYLGGDNIIAVLPARPEPLLLLEDVVEAHDAKAGVGFARVARKAMMLATLCLDRIRVERRGPRVRFCGEEGLVEEGELRSFEWETGGKL